MRPASASASADRRHAVVRLRALTGELLGELRRPVRGRHDVPPDRLGQRPQQPGDELVAHAGHLPVEAVRAAAARGARAARPPSRRRRRLPARTGTRARAPGRPAASARGSRRSSPRDASSTRSASRHVEQPRSAGRGIPPPCLERSGVEHVTRDAGVVERGRPPRRRRGCRGGARAPRSSRGAGAARGCVARMR